MDNRKMIYLDDAIDALERKKDKKAKGDISVFYNKIIQNDIDALMQLPSAQPEITVDGYADGFADGYKQGQKDAQPGPEELDFVQPHKKIGVKLEIGQPKRSKGENNDIR